MEEVEKSRTTNAQKVDTIGISHETYADAHEKCDSDFVVSPTGSATDNTAKGASEESNSSLSAEEQLITVDSKTEDVLSIHTVAYDLTSSVRPQPAGRIRTTPAKESNCTDKLAEGRKARFKALAANIDEFEVDCKPRNTCKRPALEAMALGVSSLARNRKRTGVSSIGGTEALSHAKERIVNEEHAKSTKNEMLRVTRDSLPCMQSSPFAMAGTPSPTPMSRSRIVEYGENVPNEKDTAHKTDNAAHKNESSAQYSPLPVPVAQLSIPNSQSLITECSQNLPNTETIHKAEDVNDTAMPSVQPSQISVARVSQAISKSYSTTAERGEHELWTNEKSSLSSAAPFQSSPVAECGIESFFRRKSPSTAKTGNDILSIVNIPSSGLRVHFSNEIAVIDAYEALDITTDRKKKNLTGKDKLNEDTERGVEMDSFAAIKPGHVASLTKQFESNLPPSPPTKEAASVLGYVKLPIISNLPRNETTGRKSPKRPMEDNEQPVCAGIVKKLCAKWQTADQTGQPFALDYSTASDPPTPPGVSQMAASKQSTESLSEKDLVEQVECQCIGDQSISDDKPGVEIESQVESISEECDECLNANIDVNDDPEFGSCTDLDVKDLDEDSESDSCFSYHDKSSIDFSCTTSEILLEGEATPALSFSSAMKDTSSRLRSVSSYRSHVKERLAANTSNKLVYKFPEENECPKKHSITIGRNGDQKFIQKLQELKEVERVQLEHIHQASRAINLCLSVFNFRGSPEEIDAQKALLLATEKRRCITAEIDRVTHCLRERRIFGPTEPLGTLTVAHISIPLRMEYIRRVLLPGEGALVYHFICMLKYRDTVYSTHLTSTETALNGFLEFSNYFQIDCLPPDFELKFELFCLMSEKRDGYHQPTEKKNSFILKLKKAKTARLPSRGGLPAISDASFKLVGETKITLANVRRSRFNLENLNMLIPVEGMFLMRSRCCPHTVLALKPEKGFLNVCNQGVWQLYWCVLKEGILEFWRFPEDVSKDPLKTIDLHFCTTMKPANEEITSRPNTMVLEMSISDTNEQEDVRQLLSADSENEYERWRENIDRVLSFTKVWGAELSPNVPSITSV
ncbi:Anillin-like protein 1 [Trichuris trichiura]|uniref:Anillin-like protein 1 n=1 Tax=Trichuris trichiura TaxID=36087 RepID=A0A077ZJW5_TRITR|nr:Anillin-like protein 1 [Trichuris trichiura]